jgi:WS/DGAT/MGAT family acyltransferase
MSKCDYERLTALDAAFLNIENTNAHMHVGAVVLFEGAGVRNPDGTLAIGRVRRLVEGTFRKFPRYRQRIAWIPVFRRPVWVDDHRFNLNYHVRHTALPKPGDDRALKRLAARIMSQPLDRGKPLWEMWVVEGLENDRVALVSKVHHCMIDGISGADLIASLLRITPENDTTLDEMSPRWIPRRHPSPRELVRDEVRRIGWEPLQFVRYAADSLTAPGEALKQARATLRGIGEAVTAGFVGGSETPLNCEIGPHRRFDWTATDLQQIKHIKNRLGGHVNDVVLTVAAGAIGRFLRARGLRLADLDFRAMVPVNVRPDHAHDALGNQVSSMLARLPVAEPDPLARYEKVLEMTQALKTSPQAAGVRALEDLADATSNAMLSVLAKFSARNRAYNVVITNVPGPQVPVYMLGSRMQAIYPLVPLFENQALGIAVFSYDGTLYWGFNADHDEVPDLHELVRTVDDEFAALRNAADGAAPRLAAVGH